MIKRNRGISVIGSIFSLIAFLVPAATWANLLTVEPDHFVNGISIETAYNGVTLSVQGRPGSGVYAVDGYDTFNQRNLASTGTLVFGNTPLPLSPVPTGKVWDSNVYGLLRVDFSRPTSFVQIDLLFDDDDTGGLWAYDVSGNLIASAIAQGDGRGATSPYCPPFCNPIATVSISRTQNDIAYIVAGGSSGEALFLDNLQFTVVPLPAAFWLFGSGVLGLIGFAKSRAKRK